MILIYFLNLSKKKDKITSQKNGFVKEISNIKKDSYDCPQQKQI